MNIKLILSLIAVITFSGLIIALVVFVNMNKNLKRDVADLNEDIHNYIYTIEQMQLSNDNMTDIHEQETLTKLNSCLLISENLQKQYDDLVDKYNEDVAELNKQYEIVVNSKGDDCEIVVTDNDSTGLLDNFNILWQ